MKNADFRICVVSGRIPARAKFEMHRNCVGEIPAAKQILDGSCRTLYLVDLTIESSDLFKVAQNYVRFLTE